MSSPRALIGCELLNFGLVGGDDLMAGHAEIDAGDSRVGPLIDADVAVGALHAVGQMHFVRIGDGLNRLGSGCRKIPEPRRDTVRCSTVNTGDVGGGGLRRRARILSGHAHGSKAPPRGRSRRELSTTRIQRFKPECGQRHTHPHEKVFSWRTGTYYMRTPRRVNSAIRQKSEYARSFHRARPGIMIVVWTSDHSGSPAIL